MLAICFAFCCRFFWPLLFFENFLTLLNFFSASRMSYRSKHELFKQIRIIKNETIEKRGSRIHHKSPKKTHISSGGATFQTTSLLLTEVVLFYKILGLIHIFFGEKYVDQAPIIPKIQKNRTLWSTRHFPEIIAPLGDGMIYQKVIKSINFSKNVSLSSMCRSIYSLKL